MNHNYHFTNVNEALPQLMGDLLDKGDEFGSRAGLTLELMHVGITLEQPLQREIVLPERKASIAAQIFETMWVLSGRNDVAGLSHYLPRASDFSDDGVEWRAGYGPRLRNYQGVDQLAYLVDTMAENPGSRQAVATIWDPTVDTTPGKDIACNNWLSFSSRYGLLDLHVGIRSNDAVWGWSGINAFEWSVLLEVVAHLAGLEVGSLHFSVTSFHLYDQHWEKAQKLTQSQVVPVLYDSPHLDLGGYPVLSRFDELASEWFEFEKMIRHGSPVDVDDFPEPMLRSWLRVLQWYWSGDQDFLEPLKRTRLYEACKVSVKPAGAPQPEQLEMEYLPPVKPDLLTHLNKLHAEKHAAYGDSWKRRGEIGILGNIARKVDRIGTGVATSDESQIDTAIDLVVYLAKYRCWIEGWSGDPQEVAEILSALVGIDVPWDTSTFDKTLDRLFSYAGKDEYVEIKLGNVNYMLEQAYSYALSLW